MNLLALNAIQIDESVSPRGNDLNFDYIDQLGDYLDVLPPVAVFVVEGKNILVDGFHRYYAFAAAQRTVIPVNIVGNGNITAAKDFADIANLKHGLRLTRQQKREVARRLHTRHPEYSAHRVGKLMGGIAHTTVLAYWGEGCGPGRIKNYLEPLARPDEITSSASGTGAMHHLSAVPEGVSLDISGNSLDKTGLPIGNDTESERYRLDGVRLYRADCFDILPHIETGSVDLILADLPYGTTACHWDSVLPLDQLWNEYKRIIKSNGAIVLTSAQPFTWRLCASNPDWFKDEIIWEKPNGTNPLLVHTQPFQVHENILVFYEKQPTYNPQMTFGHRPYRGFNNPSRFIGEAYNGSDENQKALTSQHRTNIDGSRYPRSVVHFAQDRNGLHPTKKPVDLMAWLIRTYTNPGELVLDNTMGAGTTGVACIGEGRKFIGIEKEKDYFNTAVTEIVRAKYRLAA